MADTIFALSSGSVPSGVAIIRLSGPSSLAVATAMAGELGRNRSAVLRTLRHPQNSQVLDEALVLSFQAPDSFTGEDVVEFHCHGGVATVEAVLAVLSQQRGCRIAEAGEFSRRAFENGRLDLTELEGLSDLIAAQTENQRKQALAQSTGRQRKLYDSWRNELIHSRALVEAELDFADEDDIPGSVSQQIWVNVQQLLTSILGHLDDQRGGEIIRDGYKIVLAGPPNAGKSSLLNALAQRDVAIVTPQAGTTRDVIEVAVNIDGQLVLLLDTAGIRQTDDIVEKEGIRRARSATETADLTLWLQPIDSEAKENMPDEAIVVRTKADLDSAVMVNDTLTASVETKGGLDDLLHFVKERLKLALPSSEQALVTRQRHRDLLQDTTFQLENALQKSLPLDLRSEHLRLAAYSLGRLTGRIDVEDLLDVIFLEFCVGK